MEGHPELERRLESLGLLRPPRENAEPEVEHELSRTAHEHLLALCDEGRLAGGLSLDRAVRPDEAFGPLCLAIGGSAKSLRLVDVLERPELRLVVARADRSEGWSVPSVRALVTRLRLECGADPAASELIVLGESSGGALQLWAVPKATVAQLRSVPGFQEEPPEAPASNVTDAPPAEAAAPSPPKPPVQRDSLRLEIEAPESARGEVLISAETERFEIGRSKSADLTLDFDEVERSHAALVRRGGWRLRPGVGSPRLTVNAVNVDAAGVLLADGDVVKLGPVILRVHVGK